MSTISELQTECDSLRQQLAQANELHTMQLAGIMTASIQNTESTVKDRIDRSNPYWTQAYEDVCVAIDREMKHRDEAKRLEAECDGWKQTVLEEIEENKKLFDLLGLKSDADFGHNTSTEAVTLKITDLLDRFNSLKAELTRWQLAFGAFQGTSEELAKAAVEDRQELNVAIDLLRTLQPQVKNWLAGSGEYEQINAFLARHRK